MNRKIRIRSEVLPAIVLLLCVRSLSGQTAASEQLVQASMLEKEGKASSSIPILRSLLNAQALDAPSTGKAWNILGLAYQDQGELSQSRRSYEESLRIFKRLSDETRDYAKALDDFGGLYLETGQFEEAKRIKTKALRIYEKVDEHAGITRVSCDLAAIEFNQKKVASGSKYLKRAVKEASVADELDDEDRATIASLRGWEALFHRDFTSSVANYKEALDIWRRRHGEEHPYTGWGHLLLGDAEEKAGQLTPALSEMRQSVAILDRTLGRQNPRCLLAEIAYSRVLDATGSHSEAARIKATAEPLLNDIYRRQCAGWTISVAALH